MKIDYSTLLDSKDGIEHFMTWARAHRIVVYPYHVKIANKYGVPTDNVIVTGFIDDPSKGAEHGD